MEPLKSGWEECTAEEAYQWSQGRAIFASGSPFAPVHFDGKTFVPGQGNNVYFFPAIGMAIYATQAQRVTDEMFLKAAQSVAEQVTQADLEMGLIYPPQSVLGLAKELGVDTFTRSATCRDVFRIADGAAGSVLM